MRTITCLLCVLMLSAGYGSEQEIKKRIAEIDKQVAVLKKERAALEAKLLKLKPKKTYNERTVKALQKKYLSLETGAQRVDFREKLVTPMAGQLFAGRIKVSKVSGGKGEYRIAGAGCGADGDSGVSVQTLDNAALRLSKGNSISFVGEIRSISIGKRVRIFIMKAKIK